MNKPLFASLPIALCFLLDPASTADRSAHELALAPAEGLVLAKSCSFHVEMSMETFTLELNGEEMELPERPEVLNQSEGVLVVRDTYGATSDGRVQSLTRAYGEVTQRDRSNGGPDGEIDEDKESDLQGLTVVFTWDDDEEDYTAEFSEDDADEDEDLLEDLEGDMDFGGLLPDDEVEEGDTWTIDTDGFQAVLEFGGDFHFDDEEDGPQEELIDEAIDENLEGEITATLTSVSDGIAVITITAELEGSAEDESTEDLGETGFEVEVARVATVTMDLEGELRWDIEGGHLVALSMSGDMTMEMDETGTSDFDGNPFEQRVVIGFEGELEFLFEYEAE